MADNIDHPSHYTHGTIEPIDVIQDWGLGFCLGNAVKYIARAGRKDPAKEIEDLRKAAWYLARFISEREDAAFDKASIRATFDVVAGVVSEVLT